MHHPHYSQNPLKPGGVPSVAIFRSQMPLPPDLIPCRVHTGHLIVRLRDKLIRQPLRSERIRMEPLRLLPIRSGHLIIGCVTRAAENSIRIMNIAAILNVFPIPAGRLSDCASDFLLHPVSDCRPNDPAKDSAAACTSEKCSYDCPDPIHLRTTVICRAQLQSSLSEESKAARNRVCQGLSPLREPCMRTAGCHRYEMPLQERFPSA